MELKKLFESKEKTPLLIHNCGIETVFLHDTKYPMREFCMWEVYVYPEQKWREKLKDIYLAQARSLDDLLPHKALLVLDIQTYKGSLDYFDKLGVPHEKMDEAFQVGTDLLKEVAAEIGKEKIIIGGQMGPRRDGYVLPEEKMTVEEARKYHDPAIASMAKAGVELVNIFTLNYVEEALGLAASLTEHGLPYTLCFTLETDGRLPGGLPLSEAIAQFKKEAESSKIDLPLTFGVNCVHPVHLAKAFSDELKDEVGFFKGNGSDKSHAELESCDTFETTDPNEWAAAMVQSQKSWEFKMIGGCCGTTVEHTRAMLSALEI